MTLFVKMRAKILNLPASNTTVHRVCRRIEEISSWQDSMKQQLNQIVPEDLESKKALQQTELTRKSVGTQD